MRHIPIVVLSVFFAVMTGEVQGYPLPGASELVHETDIFTVEGARGESKSESLDSGSSNLPPIIVAENRNCFTTDYIQQLNGLSQTDRMFELHGLSAKIFLALDPRLLAYEELYESLMEQSIDHLVAWKIKENLPLGVAVPFVKGCAVEGYGEPDEEEKLRLMYKAATSVSKNGLDARRSVNRIKKLLVNQYRTVDDSKLMAITEKIRNLLDNSPNP